MASSSDIEKFINDNWETQKCLAFNASEALFSAYMAAKTFEPTGLTWWKFLWDATQATAQLFSCTAPPLSVFEEEFAGEGLRCQCAAVGGELFLDYLDGAGNRVTLSNSEPVEAKQIQNASLLNGEASCEWETVDGVSKISTYEIGDGSKPIWYIVPTLNTGCCSDSPIIPPVQPFPEKRPVPGTQESCGGTFTHLDSCVDRYGILQHFWKVVEFYGDAYEYGPACRKSEGRYYWETIRGPYFYPRGAAFEGFLCEPEYAPPHPHKREPNGGTKQEGLVSDLSEVTYKVDVGCSWDPEEEEYTQKYEYKVEYNKDGILGLARRMDALADLMNKIQLIPYVDCKNEKPVNEGEWRTISFRSDSVSSYGSARLRKRLRYRSRQGFGLGEVVDHWKDFAFQSGPVIVQHLGSSWGSPKVWAATADEGKRVIRHAAGEAGIDPDQDGRWQISGSSSARLGVSDTMRVDTKGGYYWITARDGSDGAPIVAKTSSDSWVGV